MCMKKYFRLLFVLFICCPPLVLESCRDSKLKEFNRLLVELADNDQQIDREDWNKIIAFLDGNKAKMNRFYADNQPDTEEITEYISDFFNQRRPPGKITFIGINGKEYLDVKFYLERSGSMVPYDSPNGDGLFRSAIISMLNNLPDQNDNHAIFVVNSGINAYPGGSKKLMSDKNIFEATKGIGNAGYTDFKAILTSILRDTGDDQLSILVSDMIYSTQNMQGVNPQKVFSEIQDLTNAVFKERVKDCSLLIVKMHGSYNGLYYPYNSPSKGDAYNGQRPYYILVFGKNDTMERLGKDRNYSKFSTFQDLKGYENMYLFDTDETYDPYCSFFLEHPRIRGRFRPEPGQSGGITKLKGVSPDKNSGDIQLVLAVDLSNMLIDEAYLEDVNNYEITADDDMKIKEIRKISKKDVTPAERQYVGKATHLFVLSLNQLSHGQEVGIKLLNKLPSWVEASSSDDDTKTDSKTTFGLKYLLQGIYDSYAKNTEGKPCYFELDLKLKK